MTRENENGQEKNESVKEIQEKMLQKGEDVQQEKKNKKWLKVKEILQELEELGQQEQLKKLLNCQ